MAGDDFIQLAYASRVEGRAPELQALIAKPSIEQVSELFEASYRYRGKRDKLHLALFIKVGKKDPTLEAFRGGEKVHVDVVVYHVRASPGIKIIIGEMKSCNCGVVKAATGGIVNIEMTRMIDVIVVKGRIEDEGAAEDLS
ncbi:hypothetical protein ACLOJK_011654 [Asimina triloba]